MLEQEFVHIHGCLDTDYEKDKTAALGSLPATQTMQQQDAAVLPIFYRYASEKVGPRAALCCSGGGIGSDTFNLGVLQGLARCGRLARLHYLSSVAGGG